MDDSFFDDDDKVKSTSALLPVVELPHEGSDSQSTTARSEATTLTNRSEYSEEDTPRSAEENTQDEDVDETPRTNRSSSSRTRRKKSSPRNGCFEVDMTPPDKLLKKAEKKAKHYFKDRKADKCIKECTRCTALARIVHGDGHWKLAKTYVDLAEAYMDLKSYAPQAEYHCENASGILSSRVQLSSNTDDKASILNTTLRMHYIHGMALGKLKKFFEAEQALSRAEKVAGERAKISDVSDDDIDKWDIKIYTALAKVNGKLQKAAVATSFWEKALEVASDLHGDDSQELIPIYQGLGQVEQSKGKLADHEKAIEHYLKAHSIASKKYDDGSLELSETALMLANAYSKVGEDDAETSAESYMNEVLAIYQSHYGPNNVKTLNLQDDLARLMVRTDRAEEALSVLKSTFEPKKEVYGDFSQEVADTWKLVGSVYLSQSQTEKALKALKKCHEVESTLHGPNHKKTKATQKTIDILLTNPALAAKQKTTKAEELRSRPRFSSVVGRTTSPSLGGCKTST